MKLKPEHVQIVSWPPETNVHIGIARGVRITHGPTRCAVECSCYRSQHKNKEAALAALRILIECTYEETETQA